MDTTKKEQLLKKIKEVLENNDYNFRNREDFVESRFSWDSLAETANDFYYTILEIKKVLESEPTDSNEFTETELEEYGRNCFYKGREIGKYNQRNIAIFKHPTYEGFKRDTAYYKSLTKPEQKK